MKRGKIMLSVLEGVKKYVEESAEDIPVAGRRYGPSGIIMTSLTPRQKEARWQQILRDRQKNKEKLYRIDKRQRQKTISRLIREGFIKRTKDKINLTEKGEEKRLQLRNLFLKRSIFDSKIQEARKKETIIVSFDIPEKHRIIRDWIREVLKFLDYQMIHQSVWYGKTQLPEDFFQFLHNVDADQYVKVFTVGHRGNLKAIK